MNAATVNVPEGVTDVWRSPLAAIFRPQNVAVIGATERPGSVGRTLLWNLLSTPFGGTVFPVNPKRGSVLGIKSYPNIQAVPDPVDLAVVVTPAAAVPGVIAECAAAGVKGAIVISAGFREVGPAGVALEQEILAKAGAMRIVGPNCLGVMNPGLGLNATFASAIARPGSVGFLSQSGALCTSILDWSFQENIGFSAFVSMGSMLDVNWSDWIYYLGDDPQTKSIVMYARVVVRSPQTPPPPLAIRPYPCQYMSCFTLHNGLAVTLRPIRPEDEPLLVAFHRLLSAESVYMRYAHMLNLQYRIAHDRLTRICFIDYDREMVLVADRQDPADGSHQILGVARPPHQPSRIVPHRRRSLSAPGPRHRTGATVDRDRPSGRASRHPRPPAAHQHRHGENLHPLGVSARSRPPRRPAHRHPDPVVPPLLPVAVDRQIETFWIAQSLTLTPSPSPFLGEGSRKSGFQSLSPRERDLG